MPDAPVPQSAPEKPCRVFLTGAAGRLGSFVRPLLESAGHELVSVDVRAKPGVAELNLLDLEAVRAAMQSCDAVVHLGNHSSQAIRPPVQLFNENVSMTMNVFDTARTMQVRKIINASSIQVVAGEWVNGYSVRNPRLAYLPLDGDSPPDPTNTYALSKLVGETILTQWVSEIPLEAVSLRFPWLTDYDRPEAIARRAASLDRKERSATTIAQALSWLSYQDAARLIAQLLAAQWSGHRIYLPASPNPRARESIPELIEKFYRDIPLKTAPLTSLVDITAITRDTGWRPQDIAFV